MVQSEQGFAGYNEWTHNMEAILGIHNVLHVSDKHK